ncbi:MAG: FIST C-terminal domain-containing protein [Ideonella sp.]|nr:FIST C-terminal domain-containing protein [Ideonella sp.]MBL0150401.1 FIST C-terminal domain-containing protein [Ideonella sp.]
MSRFISAHATHPDARMALALAAAQIDAQRAVRVPFHAPTLGLVYFTDHFAAQAEDLLAELRQRWPGVAWAGGVGVGILASGVEYHDEPALALMLADLPATQFQVFSGRQPIDGRLAHTALVHADAQTHDVAELIHELADRTATGYLFGGLTSSRGRSLHLAEGVCEGGLSGVAFGDEVTLISRVTQGSQPVGPTRVITACDNNLVLGLDGEPALPKLLADLGVTLQNPQQALAAMRITLVGLTDRNASPLARGGQFGTDTRVRHLVGIDPGRDALAVADRVEVGQQLAFCRRDVQAARRDLVRICTEIRDEVEAVEPVASSAGRMGAADNGPSRIAGAVYVSCTGRGGAHFGGPSAEALIVQRALGDVPLVGFFANGEIARNQLYGYTGVLTVFTA